MKPKLLKFFRRFHVWFGLFAGALFCLMGVTGGVVALRPQIALWMAPAAAAPGNCTPDWDRAEQQVEDYARAPINRLYAPPEGDPRYHFRIATGNPILFHHVIYDACAGKVLGSVNLLWMDWLVDLHHNLLNGHAGRTWAGFIGLAMFLSAVSGLLMWLLSNPAVSRLFRIRRGLAMRDTHSMFGLTLGLLLFAGSYTALWLAFPRTMRAIFTPWSAAETRAGRRAAPEGNAASLGALMAAAQRAIPGGSVREIRFPEAGGNVQIRMWRVGDFRSLGNNVVVVDRVQARAISVELYANQTGAGRFREAMAGLHYGEWGGLWFRLAYAASGFATLLLFLTGAVYWWASNQRKSTASRAAVPTPEPAGNSARIL